MQIVKNYFVTQRAAFSGLGVDAQSMTPAGSDRIFKNPLQYLLLFFLTVSQYLSLGHYSYVNTNDIISAAYSIGLSCQGVICITKMIIFFFKRRGIVELVKTLQTEAFNAKDEELEIIREENTKCVRYSWLYSLVIYGTGTMGLMVPIILSLIGYFKSGSLRMVPPLSSPSLWNYYTIHGYLMLYVWYILRMFTLICTTVSIDTLYYWLISNIVAQFHILVHRLQKAAWATAALNGSEIGVSEEQEDRIIDCIRVHNRTLDLVGELNRVYGAITFVKFVVSSIQICCSMFFVISSGSQQSAISLIYQGVFIGAVTLQLATYCYNGQRIVDESTLVATKVYLIFPWAQMPVSTQRKLLMPMVRAQVPSEMRGVFFKVDLTLFLWVFRSASSLMAVLQTLDEP
ncbi:odorant receptor 45a-like [Musca vetustissima]|uniref:odorant receptor 45a-like n=1 Tax=Musca vetustissima TaxID=27455 RepID=UPI002AB68AC3|nr:odorant receptor 45a-like [Musca vetustissima]